MSQFSSRRLSGLAPIGLPAAWQKCWRLGFSPQFTDAALLLLQDALQSDDPELIQGATTYPPPVPALADWPCERADPVAFALWKGADLSTVGEVEEAFARACAEADRRLGGRGECRWLLIWWDESDYGTARRLLLREVNIELVRRSAGSSREEGGAA
jgi:hypothetical protein